MGWCGDAPKYMISRQQKTADHEGRDRDSCERRNPLANQIAARPKAALEDLSPSLSLSLSQPRGMSGNLTWFEVVDYRLHSHVYVLHV